MTEDVTDYYQVLECNRDASYDELKKNFQRLALLLHPDKSGNTENEEKFLLLQKAWSVLRDNERRKQFDALLICHEHSNLLLYETVLLSDMTFDETVLGYSYPCRCSGLYFLESSEAIPPSVIVACNECSFSIQVNVPDTFR